MNRAVLSQIAVSQLFCWTYLFTVVINPAKHYSEPCWIKLSTGPDSAELKLSALPDSAKLLKMSAVPDGAESH